MADTVLLQRAHASVASSAESLLEDAAHAQAQCRARGTELSAAAAELREEAQGLRERCQHAQLHMARLRMRLEELTDTKHAYEARERQARKLSKQLSVPVVLSVISNNTKTISRSPSQYKSATNQQKGTSKPSLPAGSTIMFLPRSIIMFLLFFSSLLTLSSCLSRQYYFVNVNKNWTEAQTFCRQNYTDLATIENENDQSSVIAAVNGSFSSIQIWIGQYEDVQNSWRWYLDDDTFYGVGERNYRNWGSNAPDNNGGKEICTQMVTNGFWNDVNCNLLAKFICYNGSTNSNIMISLTMNASDARQYCRQYHTDLASIRNATENEQILNLTAGQVVWIGLYRTRLCNTIHTFHHRNTDHHVHYRKTNHNVHVSHSTHNSHHRLVYVFYVKTVS
ncbi:hypothetical protein AOLI_G00109120 [Acnodon oligacanthus]